MKNLSPGIAGTSTDLRKKLTTAAIESLTPGDADRYTFDAALPGFFVRVTPRGAKIFCAQAWHGGRNKRITLGSFPEMLLSDARTEARNMLLAIRAGIDPLAEKAQREAAHKAGDITVGVLADRWLSEHVRPKLKPRTADDYTKIIEGKIKPALGSLTVSRVTKDHVFPFHAAMARTPRRANYTLAVFRTLMSFAEDVGLRPPMSNPCRRLKLFREGKRERFLSEAEIARAAEAITAAERSGRIGPHVAAGLRLCLLTGARSGEITMARWEHVDWQRSLIRLPDSKTNEPRTIHLSAAAIEALRTLPRVGPYIVAGARADEPFKTISATWIAIRGLAGLDDVRLHDLRHSYASLAAARGVSLQMIGKLLGHKAPATTARYAHLTRDAVAAVNDELGVALQAAIARGQPESAEVLRMPRRPGRRGRV